jgi:hypothetical protein
MSPPHWSAQWAIMREREIGSIYWSFFSCGELELSRHATKVKWTVDASLADDES